MLLDAIAIKERTRFRIVIGNRIIFNGSTTIFKLELCVLAPLTVLIGNNNLFRVSPKCNVCIMRNDNYLTSFFTFFDKPSQLRINRLVVQVILWLVNKNGAIALFEFNNEL